MNIQNPNEQAIAEEERRAKEAAAAALEGAADGGIIGFLFTLIQAMFGSNVAQEPDNYVEMASQNQTTQSRETLNSKNYVSSASRNEYLPLSAEDAIINKLLSNARAEVGVEEVGKNGGADVARYMATAGLENQGLPWCAGFMSYICESAMPGAIKPTAGSLDLMRQTQAIGSFKEADSGYKVQAGDFIFLDRKQTGDAFAHVGFVDEVRKDGTIVTIEGNIGDKVVRREYSPKKLAESRLLGFASTRETIRSQLSPSTAMEFAEADVSISQAPLESGKQAANSGQAIQ